MARKARANEVKSDSAVAESSGQGELIERTAQIPDEINLLPLQDSVLFPGVVMPLLVARPPSMQLVDDAVVGESRVIAVAALREPGIEGPQLKDVHPVGVVAAIHTMLRLPDGQRLIVQGLKRVGFKEATQTEPYLRVRIEELPDIVDWAPEQETEVEALKRSVADAFVKVVSLSPNLPDELQSIAKTITQPALLADTISLHLPLPVSEKQALLETCGIRQRLSMLLELLRREVEVMELRAKIQDQVSTELGRTQREYYLREQLKAIQRELGEADERTLEIEELRERVQKSGMPPEAEKEANRELDRLSRMPPAAPEYTVSRTFIDWLIALPWSVSTEDNLDIPNVRRILDEDHYGLEKIKDRILEYLSVRKFKTDGTMRHPILCFVGPPGVGKTSLGRSIARALGRKFVRISLGGIRDEAEIRGHRRTYIGALPGQIIQGIRRAESHNPIFMLDEIDKVGADFRGDPSSALLEVLDPEQNFSFRDHYVEVPFDLSKVLFITTANVLETVLPPLRDRMEILQLAGYTEEEKLGIAKQHLVPKQMSEHGLEAEKHISWQDDALREIIRGYTREAGVRNLEREIAAVCRKTTREFAEGRKEPVNVDIDTVRRFLGAPRYLGEEIKDRLTEPGIAIGLAVTPTGGEVMFVEASKMPGAKSLTLTGQLGDVMKESAQAALSYVRSHAEELGVDPAFFKEADLHLHVPAGAIPKDGPSAGITMAIALASLLTGKRARPNVAVTGEITLRGRVLPVGGIKEKALAARRAGIKTVILPEENRKDVLEEIPKDAQEEMEFIYIREVSEALDHVLGNRVKKSQSARRSKQSSASV